MLTVMMSLNSRKKILAASVALFFCRNSSASEVVEFNTDVLDVSERSEVDLSTFINENYISPGDYWLQISINNNKLPRQKIKFYPDEKSISKSQPCLPPDLINAMALKDEMRKKIVFTHDNTCADLSAIPDVRINSLVGKGEMKISIPQAWMKYSDPNWTPPEQWDDGVPGLLLDYNLNGQINKRFNNDRATGRSLSGYGTVGGNAGSWRLRADYQLGMYDNQYSKDRSFDWNRIYAFRALPQQASVLSMGELFLESNVFNSFRFTGLNVRSDEQMLPPSLQGYAPEIQGVANDNAKVTVSQEGRIVYETTVPAGPFLIQNLSNALRGKLDVRVEEQNGKVTHFQVNTASTPYLTRPGRVRYNIALGVPSTANHRINDNLFATADASWGISNHWTVYGGAIIGGKYNSWNSGIGVDLNKLGAMTFDITQSLANLQKEGVVTGLSFNVNYAKRFDSLDSQISFAGYRFAQRKFMDMSQYQNLLSTNSESDTLSQRDKQSFTISLNKTFWRDTPELNFTTFLNYTEQNYWNAKKTKRFDFYVSKSFDIANIRDITLSAMLYQSKTGKYDDYGGALSISVPISQGRRAGYNLQVVNKKDVTQTASFSSYVDPNNTWQISGGANSDGKGVARGYYTHSFPEASMTLNTSMQQDQNVSAGLSLRGGLTATQYGAAMHRNSSPGSTRIMVDTDGIGQVPVNQGRAVTNRFGLAVLSDASSYYDMTARIDVKNLPDDIEARRGVVQGTLTEGAIGYRNFDVVKGKKVYAVLRTSEGKAPPFGAVVKNSQGQEVTIVNDDGSVYLTGVNSAEKLSVNWSGGRRCQVTIPEVNNALSQLLLPCE